MSPANPREQGHELNERAEVPPQQCDGVMSLQTVLCLLCIYVLNAQKLMAQC